MKKRERERLMSAANCLNALFFYARYQKDAIFSPMSVLAESLSGAYKNLEYRYMPKRLRISTPAVYREVIYAEKKYIAGEFIRWGNVGICSGMNTVPDTIGTVLGVKRLFRLREAEA